ncbi:MAG: AAA family ATPase [Pseudomonadales bacterium]
MSLPPHLSALLDAGTYPHACGEISLVETHISWVLLTGSYAYKLKKPVRFPFVDFSTLERREHFCREELRCNRAFAPELYHDVVALTRRPDGAVQVGGGGEIVEWAVRMRQFPPERQLDRLLARDGLDSTLLHDFGVSLAALHGALPGARNGRIVAREFQPVRENFATLAGLSLGAADRAVLRRCQRAALDALSAHASWFCRRASEHRVRECHGDLHLSNMVLMGDRVVAFDCVEFDPALRWIDTFCDIAFLFMDCLVRNRADLAYAFLDGYLDGSGDYGGLVLLRHYAAYRSLVRAKVAALQADWPRMRLHLRWGAQHLRSPPGSLILTCGLSGSGKSYLATRLVPLLPAIRLRSDVARKALAGLAPDAHSGSRIAAGLYTADRSRKTYDWLADLAVSLARQGETVIVDATFLQAARREQFLELARSIGLPVLVLYCTADEALLRRRVLARAGQPGEPSEADVTVLEAQLAGFEPPAPGPTVVCVDTGDATDLALLARQLRDVVAAQATSGGSSSPE